ncbi:MAG: YcaO-like family protein [Alphaproteobacteria bacterium]|nr:YcaO-like family protein [Alphaproteobacteria bacterium]
MSISWPATLPLPSIEGYGVHPGEAILRTEMEAGPARQRRRFTSVPSRISVRWVLRRDQFALFEAWYRWHAKEGGEWFGIDLLGGLGLVTHEARFTRQFAARPLPGNRWEVTSELEIRERPVLTEDASSVELPFLRRMERHYGELGLAFYALDLTQDFGIPVIIAVGHRDGKSIMFGLGAHLDPLVALNRAYSELNQMLELETGFLEAEEGDTEPEGAIADWFRTATLENQTYLKPDALPAVALGDMPSFNGATLADDVDYARGKFEEQGLEMLVFDHSRPEVDFSCARVVVPGIRHFWARFAPGRLYDVPVKMGWLDKPNKESELNPIPFFL